MALRAYDRVKPIIPYLLRQPRLHAVDVLLKQGCPLRGNVTAVR